MFWGLLGWTRRRHLDREAVDEGRGAIAAELAARDHDVETPSSVVALFPRVTDVHDAEPSADEPSLVVRLWDTAWLGFHTRGRAIPRAYYLLLVAASLRVAVLELAPLLVP